MCAPGPEEWRCADRASCVENPHNSGRGPHNGPYSWGRNIKKWGFLNLAPHMFWVVVRLSTFVIWIQHSLACLILPTLQMCVCVCVCVLGMGLSFPFLVVQLVKNLPASAGDARDMGSIPGSGRFPGEGNGNPFQYSCKFWKIPWTEEPGGLQSMGHRVRCS